MMTSIKHLAFRFFKSNKLMALSSLVSVMLSIAMIITMASFSTNAKQALKQEVQEIYGDMDIAVGFDFEQTEVIDLELQNRLLSHEQIKASSSLITTRLFIDVLEEEIYTIGLGNDPLAKGRFYVQENMAKNEVILSEALAERLMVERTEPLMIEDKEYIVKAVISNPAWMDSNNEMMLLHKDEVKKHYENQMGYSADATHILMSLYEGANVYEVADLMYQIHPELKIDIASENEFLKENIHFLNQFILVLSILVLIVTSLFIMSNFDVFLYKYTYQLAVMRSMGASAKQLFIITFIQSSLINGIGAICGFILALIIHAISHHWLQSFFNIEVNAINFPYGMALLLTIVSMLFIQLFMILPAYRSTRVLPLISMRENAGDKKTFESMRKKIAWVILFVSAGLLILGVSEHVQGLLLFAVFTLIMSIFYLLPFYLITILNHMLPLIRSLFGRVSFVAVKNMLPQVKSNTLIILTISVMMVIAIFGSSLFKSIQINDENWLKEQYVTSIILSSRTADSVVHQEELTEWIYTNVEVENVSTLSKSYIAQTNFELDGLTYYSVIFANLEKLAEQDLLDELPSNIDNGVIVSTQFANEHQLQIGDLLEMEVIFGIEESGRDAVFTYNETIESGTVVIAAITDSYLHADHIDLLIDWNNKIYPMDQVSFETAFIHSEDENKAIKQLEGLRSEYPTVQIDSLSQSISQSKEMFSQRWALFIIVLFIILVSVLLGTFNTILNNINTKRKEYAILRAISLGKGNIVRVMMTQVFLYISTGIFLGTVIGVFFTFTMSLIDPDAALHFDISFIALMIITTFVIACIIFIPLARRIANKNISLEMTTDIR